MYSFISILWLRLSGDGTSLADLISFAILHFKVIFKRIYRYDIPFRSSSGIIQGRHSSPKRTIIVSNSLDAESCILYEAYLINRTLWELTLIPSSSHPLLLHSHVLLFQTAVVSGSGFDFEQCCYRNKKKYFPASQIIAQPSSENFYNIKLVMRSYHSDGCKNYCFMACDSVQIGKQAPIIRWNVLPPSSTLKIEAANTFESNKVNCVTS